MERGEKMKRVTFIFEDELHKRAKIRAIENDLSLKDYVFGLIEKDLRKEKENAECGTESN